MSLEYQCPGCGTRYTLQDALAGKRVKCKKCGESVRVPTNGATDVDQSAVLIRLTCDSCGKSYNLPAHLGGKRGRCKACGHDMMIPAAQKAVAGLELGAMAPPPPDIYGLDESSTAPMRKGIPGDGAFSDAPSPAAARSEVDENALPPRAGYEPMTDAKRKQIARRAAKAQSSRSFSGTGMGVSFGTVLMITLLLGRFYFRFQRGARIADNLNTAIAAPADVELHLPTVAELDKEIATQISQPITAEASEWLDPKHADHGLMKMSNDKARALVAGFYERGAEKVYVLDPAKIGQSVISAEVAVKLPTDPARRKGCFEWCNHHFGQDDPEIDKGQSYLLLMTD